MKKLLIVLLLTGCAANPQPFKENKQVSQPLGDKKLQEREHSKADKIFQDLRDKFEYVSDINQYKKNEYWATPEETIKNGLKGDCDDFAVLAQSELAKVGIRSRLVVATDRAKKGHLFVITESGWILDNRENFLMTKDDLNYTFIKQSGFVGDSVWHEIVE